MIVTSLTSRQENRHVDVIIELDHIYREAIRFPENSPAHDVVASLHNLAERIRRRAELVDQTKG